jgi:glycine hydroxymethyltransferase
MNLSNVDPMVSSLIEREMDRQRTTINLIPSENYPSSAVLEAMSSILTSKYSEGYPGKRYYQGNSIIDEIENIAIQRARDLFGVEHVNVQPLSGVPANHAVYLAFCQPGDPTMGIEVPSGGHLSHGERVTFIGKYFRPSLYKVDQGTETIDYDAFQTLAAEVKPKLIWIGVSSYPRHYDFPRLSEVAKSVGAYLVVDLAHVIGLVAAGVYPSPVPYADVITATTHKTLRGPRGAMIMCREEFAKQIDKAVFPGLQGGPHENVVAGIAVALQEAQTPEFKDYARQVLKNAEILSETLLADGFDLVSGGTDNHLMSFKLDSLGFEISGREAATLLEKAGLIANAQPIPYDTHSRFNPGGIRYGTPAATTRGMKEAEMRQIGLWTRQIFDSRDDEKKIMKIREEVRELCQEYPIPAIS